ncbi:hypothetical protein LshimejAT787_0101560 [Lyophyllum shimeji]|uniref:F-box domain-containing protein n=1 Tax=Lyophyllum shimeji TaxID=47721 RepID=A0A9P3UHN1_LYOSH|nr:hypothetical protein LshimejAT787_0101470 [Lyophyllum shimeji]GLB33272.1 hypothetical protein LshimejAT787_0101560 [Lyophyllum shimeji]
MALESSSNELQILNDDVLLKIFSFCDIATVVAISETTRHFHTLASSRQVWLSLIRELHQRNFLHLEREKGLEDLTKPELVALAKRVVFGPRSFSSESGKDGLKVTRQIILKPTIPLGPGILDWENETLLLPNSDFVLFRHLHFECIDVASDKVIWRHTGHWSGYKVQVFTAELVDEGTAAIIVAGIRTYERDRQNFVEVLRLDFETGTSTSLLLRNAPNTDFDNPFRRLRMSGDFVVATIGSRQSATIFVLQLSTGLCCTVDVPAQPVDIDLVPGHLIMLWDSDEFGELHLGVWGLHNLIQSATSTGAIRTPISTFPPIHSETMDVSNFPGLSFRMSCHPSPLHTDSSRLWVLISTTSVPSNGSPRTLLRKYHVTHPRSRAISIRSVAQWEHADSFPIPTESSEISYGGWVETYYGGQHFYSLASDEPCIKNLDLPNRGDFTHLSPYSLALTYSTYDSVVINYYE